MGCVVLTPSSKVIVEKLTEADMTISILSNPMFQALCLLIALDYVTGIAVAYSKKELDSSKGFNGLFVKFALISVVIVANVFISLYGEVSPLVMSAIFAFFVANEGLSVLEHAALLGVPIPKQLKLAMAKLKEEVNDAA